VLACFTDMMTAVKPNRPILISSQLPVGTCDEWQGLFPQHTLSVNPENIRKATAREDFRHQARMIVGTNTQYLYRDMFTNLLSPFTDDILWMSPRSAEMAKHVLNGYLAMCIVFANEIRDICEMMRCDVADVFCGFRSDPRVSMTAPLEPGGPYSGGTIGRDVRILRSHSIKSPSLLATVDDANRKRL
jgi:UDPglucose 6-dehydrogenase